jgi:cytochrome P450
MLGRAEAARRMQPDLFTAEFQENPYPTYAWLREHAPVYREPRFGNFVVTRFADALEVLRDHATFSSARGQNPAGPQAGVPSIATSDPPLHDQLRALVSRAFTPRRVAESEPRIRALAHELLAALPGRAFDLVPAIAVPVPVIVISTLLGVSPDRAGDFRRWSDALVGLMERPRAPDLMAAALEMVSYFRSEVIPRRRAAPQDDLVSALLAAEIDGRKLSEQEIESFCLLLLVAGNETTTNLISNQLRVLSQRPELWKRLRDDRSLVPAALEETVRWDSPVQNLARDAARDVALHGVQIAAGERVLVSFAAANRDAREFPDAESYRLDRGSARHLGFGFGVHFCLGAGLARLEARCVLDAMLERFAEIAPGADAPRRTRSSVIRGFESLPLVAA